MSKAPHSSRITVGVPDEGRCLSDSNLEFHKRLSRIWAEMVGGIEADGGAAYCPLLLWDKEILSSTLAGEWVSQRTKYPWRTLKLDRDVGVSVSVNY